MKWKILHESKGRMRLHLNKPRMSLAEADQLQDYLAALPGVRTAAVYERTCDVVVVYTENRASLVKGLAAFRFDVEALAEVPANSPRAVNREYQEKLVNMTIFHFVRKLFLPMPLCIAYTAVRSLPYLWRGLTCLLRRKLEVEVLDAAAKYMFCQGFFFWSLGILNTCRMTTQGLGYSGRAVFSGVTEMVARIVVSLIFVPVYGYTAICFGDQTAWISACIYILPTCLICMKKVGADFRLRKTA